MRDIFDELLNVYCHKNGYHSIVMYYLHKSASIFNQLLLFFFFSFFFSKKHFSVDLEPVLKFAVIDQAGLELTCLFLPSAGIKCMLHSLLPFLFFWLKIDSSFLQHIPATHFPSSLPPCPHPST